MAIIFLQLVLLGILASITQAAVWPGPQTTEIENGVEVWKAAMTANGQATTTYNVRSMNPLPVVVYNCYNVPALCNGAKRYLGARTSATFHYDRWSHVDRSKTRTHARREESCATDWIKTLRADGSNRCPEPDQPSWKYGSGGVTVINEPMMWRKQDGTEISNNRLAKKITKRDADGNDVTQYTTLGAILSCDEFPAASWIEGGTGAATYCAPFAMGCKIAQVEATPPTEQGWQSSAFSSLATHFDSDTPKKSKNHRSNSREYTIWKFNFRYENVNDGNAVYVESSAGTKKYCYGPNPTC